MDASDGVPRYIPVKIDDPVTIMLMEPIQFVLIVSSLGLGMVMDMFLFGMLLAYFFFVVLKRLKRGAKRGAGQHAMWAAGINLDNTLKKNFPDPVDNEFIS